MDDRQLRIWFQIIFSMATFIIFCFINPFTSPLGVVIIALLTIPVLSYTFPWLIDSLSQIYIFLIYGPDYSDPSYENRFYQDDMDKAKRLMREGEWDKAMHAYREIVQKSPMMCEPKFNLAQLYQMAGHLGLALNEYKKIVGSKNQFGSTHLFVLESERAVEELKHKPSEIEQDCSNNP